MSSDDPDGARTGIVAFNQLGPIAFDTASFREVVRRLLGSPDVTTRAGALTAFALTGAEAEDLPCLYALADDPAEEIRSRLTGVIMAVNQNDLTGDAATAAILKLIANPPSDSRMIAHALWSGRFSPELEARILEKCREMDGFGDGYNYFYGALSTQANKSEESVKRLIEILANPDTTNKAGRAAWGLKQGVDKAQYSLVANAMLRVRRRRAETGRRARAREPL